MKQDPRPNDDEPLPDTTVCRTDTSVTLRTADGIVDTLTLTPEGVRFEIGGGGVHAGWAGGGVLRLTRLTSSDGITSRN